MLTPGDRKAITEVARYRAEPIRAMLERTPSAGTRVIASGGTVRALARLAMGLHRPLSTGSVSSLQVNQVEIPLASSTTWPTGSPRWTWTPVWPSPGSRVGGRPFSR